MSTATAKQTITTELDAPKRGLLDEVIAKTKERMRDIQSIVDECSVQAVANMEDIEKAIRKAVGIKKLKEMLTDEIMDKVFMPLQGSQLGFFTDKDRSGGYDRDTVRECLIAGFLNGVWPTNQEINIISGKMYIAKEGMRRLCKEFPGVTHLDPIPGVPQNSNGGALVSFIVRWKYNGEEDCLECLPESDRNKHDTRIPVKVNNGMGTDAIIGKAERKALARVYSKLSGIDLPTGEISDEIMADSDPRKVARSSAADVLGTTVNEPEAAVVDDEKPKDALFNNQPHHE